ncbi:MULTISPECIES: phosphoribosylanthranilate isomerase [Thiorhodovibrio]|uniref:phosphoribosylanthranilate isomerase n=1 Tax=Thiorhodovibrio TaxID=61593 RepID=UPI0019123D34|nr:MULTISPECIES: phosphoribosylanthranilate isomerase [Thiorhodovibrio]MBK5970599.1 N-(5'-phosphoribosyl)anthranilate isomerase [Thiorhodovibrio winogradskyi]WPL12776.1 N-(5'-phosphoribosyl)anthranilate isomerase [Thiorhodovibrio litoralis]
MKRTRVKLCGLTREQDIQAAVAHGADAIGLVFYDKSARAVDVEQARALAATVPAFVTLVGLFVDADPALVQAVLKRVPLGALQFHGAEPPDYCCAFDRPWIKAVAVREGVDLARIDKDYQSAASLLLDTYDPKKAGGTGRCFDWDLVPAWLAPRSILAGGLTPENVAAAIAQVRPHAVDVSGGIEQDKGNKDSAKIQTFMQEVANGDQSR